jgi:hypothetical protein
MQISDVLTSATILVAIITWRITFQRGRQSEKTARTAEVIANISTSEHLAEATYQVSRLINAGRRIRYDGLDQSTERWVVMLLDYYEYMCELYESGILSKTTIVNLSGRLMVRTYDACEQYISETRKRQNRQVYAAFERLVLDVTSKDRAAQ